jgi:hydroxypyruvate reductase
MARGRAAGLDALHELGDNNSYAYFDTLEDLIRTGPTGTNVNDLLFLFVLPVSDE